MLHWANPCSMFLFLDSNQYPDAYGRYECLMGVFPERIWSCSEGDNLFTIANWHHTHRDWIFGHICYDYKNSLEPRLKSRHASGHAFPDLQFFVPGVVLYILRDTEELVVSCRPGYQPEDIFAAIQQQPIQHPGLPQVHFQLRIPERTYQHTIRQLQAHIRNGDCYEINFCNEGYAEDVSLSPVAAYQALTARSPTPFAFFYRVHQQYAAGASPERYLTKQQSRLIAQPIKGTIRRGKDETEDARLRRQLYESEKDRAENVMIVDLMRNDLARSCVAGSVQVDELFGIYSFPQVHQMISTISGTLIPDSGIEDAIRNSFPMGSMTGAPKIKVMELIDHYESARRGLFSGTVGYISPDGDFDFNVIIRTLFYNAATQYLSYQTGGAITYDSDPEQEWQEMRLKASAIESLFR